jgi:chaperonin GroEL
VLPGGGVALLQASKLLESGLPQFTEDSSERLGVKILSEALKQPIRLLIENKTCESAAHTLEKIGNDTENMFSGFDVKTMRICDVVDNGIVDSYSVVRTYLQDSVSLSGMLLTTETLVVRDKSYEPLSLKHYQDRRDFF